MFLLRSALFLPTYHSWRLRLCSAKLASQHFSMNTAVVSQQGRYFQGNLQLAIGSGGGKLANRALISLTEFAGTIAVFLMKPQ